MKVTVISHNISSNAVMRAHRIAKAASAFAEVELIGPVERSGPWPALPREPWIRTVPKIRFPGFHNSFLRLVDGADGDVLVAIKPKLSSFGVALVAAQQRERAVVLDVDDLDEAFAPRSAWAAKPSAVDLSRPGSMIYTALLSRAAGGASAITAASTALQLRFGATLVAHGSDTGCFDPSRVDRACARRKFGFQGPTVLFPGTPRIHKGVAELARAIGRIESARLAVTCRDTDLSGPEWEHLPVIRVPFVGYYEMPELLAAADIIAVPQLDTEAARYQMPMKVFDAMAMAKPLVASAISDLPMVLEGCARLVAPGDVDQMTSAIMELLRNRAYAADLGGKARRRCIEKYSMAKVSEVLRELFEKL